MHPAVCDSHTRVWDISIFMKGSKMSGTLTGIMAVLLLALLSMNPARAADNGHDPHDRSKQMDMEHTVSPGHDPYTLSVDPLGDSLAKVNKPVAVIHDGRQLLFASNENAHTFKQHPDKYLADVDAMIIKQQAPTYPLTTCVISGEKLGEMGKPIQRVISNRLVTFCCSGCIGKAQKEPAKYLAKIDAAVIETQTKDYPLSTCLVSGEKLGGEMGAPIHYVAGTQLVKFCCKGCIKKFEKNPAHYLSKLGQPTPQQDSHTNHNH
jgi:YHS domain-containing protein